MKEKCIGIQRVKLYYNLSVLSWHSAMLETEKNIELALVLFFIFVLPLFFVFENNGKALFHECYQMNF